MNQLQGIPNHGGPLMEDIVYHIALAYQTLRLDTMPTEDTCSMSIKCALGDSLNQDCKCKNTTQCRQLTIGSCLSGYSIYPRSGPIISPYAYMVYILNGDWIEKKHILIGFARADKVS